MHAVSANLTMSISDHLPSLVADVININWKPVLEIEKGDTNLTFENYNKKMKEVISIYLPLKRLSKKRF